MNDRTLLERWLALCRARGRPSPTIVSVDFYATGGARPVVARLNAR